ncbi:MAG TPA: cytidylate kinase-like family protein [Candidatus Blautia faecigallinarum]|uniref:Cytidylate kinase-like family protein n=1 Tax=Candidatus Blautia faecigallinarum TaxID=2838488 RepID=A0A9D2DRK3_9FIRM|nr:cytidylate kinase-like family protein [Candidatus Blautia faecigallinarum]
MSKRIITINRMFGSNGRVIGKALAEDLGIQFYDKELIAMASKEKQVPFSEFAKVDEKKASQWTFPVDHEFQIDTDFHLIPMNDVLYDIQRKIILSLSEKEDCVIVGRCANHILKDKTLSIFIYAPFEVRVQNVIARTGREEKSVRKLVKKMDKERRAYYEYFTDNKWTDLSQYNLCIDSGHFSTDQILNMIKGCL